MGSHYHRSSASEIENTAEDIARRLEEVAEEAIAFLEEDARASAARLAETLGPASPELHLDVNTFAYDVGSSWRPFDWPTQASTS